MEEIIALEKQIRTALAGTLKAPSTNLTKLVMGHMIKDGIAILAGQPTTVTGTRLERLRIIAKALNQDK